MFISLLSQESLYRLLLSISPIKMRYDYMSRIAVIIIFLFLIFSREWSLMSWAQGISNIDIDIT